MAPVASGRKSQQRSLVNNLRIMLWALLLMMCTSSSCRAQEAYDDLMNEVLQEAEHYEDYHTMEDTHDGPTFDEEERRRQMEGEAEELRRQQEELARERIERQREEAFEAELKQMSEEKRKAALKQKRKDTRIVRRVLRAAKRGNHYGVLGLRNIGIHRTGRTVTIGGFELTVPVFSLFHVSQKAIRKAYRAQALSIHPDKNRDGRAEEAFMAVEHAASILSDETLRAEYDDKLKAARENRNSKVRHLVGNAFQKTFSVTNRVITVFRKVLGPFAFPAVILGTLLV